MQVVHYRFLPKMSAGGRQIGLNLTTKRLKLRKTLHLADTIGDGTRIQQNPPPGTSEPQHLCGFYASIRFTILLGPRVQNRKKGLFRGLNSGAERILSVIA